MKKNLFLFSLLAVFLAWFWFGGISMADYVATTGNAESCVWESPAGCYDTLAAAISAAESGATVTLLKDVSETPIISWKNNITLDLGNNTLSVNSYWLDIYNSTLTVRNGTINSTGRRWIYLNYGNTFTLDATAKITGTWGWIISDLYPSDKTETNTWVINGEIDVESIAILISAKSSLTLNNGAKIKGENGIVIWEKAGSSEIVINWDIEGSNVWVTINGNLKSSTDCPTLTIWSTAKLTATGDETVALYLAGYGKTTIATGANLQGDASAIEIRAWELTIDWWTFTSTATWWNVTVTANWNWSTTVWAALAIAQHTTKQTTSVNINWWTFEWIAAIYQSNPQNNSADDSKNVTTTITEWTFNWEVSNTEANSKLDIQWWTFSNDVNAYTVEWKYSVKNSEWQYEVKKLTPTKFDMSSNLNTTIPVVLNEQWSWLLLNETKAVLGKETWLTAWALLIQFNDLATQDALNDVAKVETVLEQKLLFFKQALGTPAWKYKIWVFTESIDNKPFSDDTKFIWWTEYNEGDIVFDSAAKVDPFGVSSWIYVKKYNAIGDNWYALYAEDAESNWNQGWFYAPKAYKVTFNTDWGVWTYEAQIVALTDWKATKPETDPTKEWYIFDGWFKWEDNTAFDFDTVIADDTELKAHWSTAYTITLNSVSNWTISTDKEVAKEWDTITLTATPNSNYKFTSWTVKNGDADVTVTNNTFTMPAGNVTVSATFTKKSSWGGGGSSSNSSNTTANDWDDTPDDTADDPTQGDTTTINPELTDVESQEWYDNWWDQKEVLDNGLTRELNNAYEFAFRAGITTMKSAENANMEWTLNRIAMAKMLSQYAINVLGKKPDTSRTPNFWDVADSLDKDYDNGVTLAYQLGIMGIWIDEFRPYDEVPRAEFVTALSRLLYGLADWTDNYYSTHMAKLQKEWIITNTDPNLLELRGYVMLMLMRSAK